MAKSGGPATLYGVLFQLLGNSHRAVTFALRDFDSDGKDLKAAQLVIEPEDGGDIRIEDDRTVVVEQWKSKRTRGAWSLRRIIKEVLPDLYLAVSSQNDNRESRYVFCCQGNVANWSAARQFFGELGHREAATNSSSVQFMAGQSGRMQETEFFDFIRSNVVESLQRRGIEIDDSLISKKLRHLLCRFDVQHFASAESIQNQIDSWLIPWVNDSTQESIAAVRDQLCMQLLRLGKAGGTRVKALQLLESCGIHGVPLTHWSVIHTNMSRIASEDASAITGYKREFDVRPTPVQSTAKRILLITGNGGYGKSWQLASVLGQAYSNGRTGVLVRATGNMRETLGMVSKKIWLFGAKRETEIAFEILCRKIARVSDNSEDRQLLVCIDDVQSVKELNDLIEIPWSSLNAELVVACAVQLADTLQKSHEPIVDVIEVGEFSQFELTHYLRLRKRDWVDLPDDIEPHLRQPLLADLYCDLADGPEWQSDREYEIFSRHWDRLKSASSQAMHQDDQAKLRDLAGSLITCDEEYPWQLGVVNQAGLDTSAIDRLCSMGWLSREAGRIRFRHARLMNWAVAQSFSDRLRFRGDDALREVITWLSSQSSQENEMALPLGYVAMDLMYALGEPDHPAGMNRGRILFEMERNSASYHYVENLYEHLMPTLGDRCVATVCDRMENFLVDDRSLLPYQAARCMIASGSKYSGRAANSLIRSKSKASRKCGLWVLKSCPVGEACDELLRQLRKLGLETAQAKYPETAHDMHNLIEAIWSCASCSPSWLKGAIENESDPSLMNLFIRILGGVEGAAAHDIWKLHRGKIFSVLGGGDWRLARAFKRLATSDLRCEMQDWAQGSDPDKAFLGFCTLVTISPSDAIEALPSISPTQLAFHWHYWLDDLCNWDQDAATAAIQGCTIDHEQNCGDYGSIFMHRMWRMPIPCLKKLVCRLRSILREIDTKEHSFQGDLRRVCETLARIATVEQLKFIRSTDCESAANELGQLAADWAATGHHEHEMEAIESLLLIMGGAGFQQYVNARLLSCSQWKRLNAISLAAVDPDEQTLDSLVEVVQREEPYESSRSKSPALAQDAIQTLIALGEHDRVVDGILRNGLSVTTALQDRVNRQPISDESLAPFQDAVGRDDAEARRNALLFIGVSGRKDMVPLIHNLLKHDSIDTETQFGAIWALLGLDASDDFTIECFRNAIDDPSCGHVAKSGLLRIQNSTVDQIFCDYLSGKSVSDFWRQRTSFLEMLTQRASTRLQVIELAWSMLRERGALQSSLHSPLWLNLIGELTDPKLLDFLLQQSKEHQTGFHIGGRRAAAIRGLAKIDPDAAFEAAVQGLKTSKKEQHLYPAVLASINPIKAIQVFVETLQSESNVRIERAILSEIRCLREDAVLTSIIERMLKKTSQSRLGAFKLLKWLPSSWAALLLEREVATEDRDYVRENIFDAIAFHERHRECARVLDEMSLVDDTAALAYSLVLLQNVDLELLGSGEHKFDLSVELDRRPAFFRKVLDAKFKKLQKELERTFKT